MVPFSSSIWCHILLQYGTIFYRNMVPYSFRVSPLLKINKAKTRFQNKPFSFSKRLFFLSGSVAGDYWGSGGARQNSSFIIREFIIHSGPSLLHLTRYPALRCTA